MDQPPPDHVNDHLTGGDYFVAFMLALSSRHPFKNLGLVLAHLFGLVDLPDRKPVSAEP